MSSRPSRLSWPSAALSLAAALALLTFSAAASQAGAPKTLDVQVEPAGVDGDTIFYNFTVTIAHEDEGWRHFADAFEVLDAANGKLLGIHRFLHPHEDEQPFTRTLYRLPVPSSVERVRIRAHDKVHGYEPEPMEVDLPAG
ncbi:MAG: hypothetical protein AAF909_00690 [Pseudomonadota bacterium]